MLFFFLTVCVLHTYPPPSLCFFLTLHPPILPPFAFPLLSPTLSSPLTLSFSNPSVPLLSPQPLRVSCPP